ncbi:MAG: exosortase/archaeosortase family protein [Candidatus Sulfotelmatobacter sp.]
MIRTAVTESATVRSGRFPPARYFELSALIAGSIALWWQPLVSTVKLAFGSDAYTHILLIAPLSVALIYFERRRVSHVLSPRGWAGWIFLSAAVLVRVVTIVIVKAAPADIILSLNIFGLVLWWIGSAVISFGPGILRSLAFPLCFLFLIIPAPAVVVNWITGTLQHQSAIGATLLFRIAQVPVTREGLIISIPGLDLEVARECSSIRSSTMLIVITLVLAHLFLKSRWRKILLLAVSLPLAVAKNAIRILTIAQLGARVDPAYLDGKLHHNGGILFLALAVIVIVLLLWFLRRNELRTSHLGAAEI